MYWFGCTLYITKPALNEKSCIYADPMLFNKWYMKVDLKYLETFFFNSKYI